MLTLSAGFLMLMTMLMTVPATGQASDGDLDTQAQTQKLWDELMHYAMIGNWELAVGNGQALIQLDPDPVQLLDMAESVKHANHYRNLTQLQKGTPLQEVAADITRLIEKGRFMRRTDEDRIVTEVKRLSAGGTRGRVLAIGRLKDSSEWAVPAMIETLRDSDRSEEYANIRWALPQLGKAAVNPLVVVLQNSRNLNLRIVVLGVLGKIGYPSALPYIQEIIESKDSVSELKSAALKATNEIHKGRTPAQGSGAEMFEQWGKNYYNYLPSLIVPQTQELANIWFWDQQNGLYKEEVPRGAFDELMTMRFCENAVRMDATRNGAISLWLSSFFRLEAQNYEQPAFFGETHADAHTYALTAGPEYLHRVLARAMTNRNRPVALAAIKTLQLNAGQQSLLYELMGQKPLVQALSFADREVRFSAALAIGGILPKKNFEGKSEQLTVTILAEALQQKGKRFAMVADNDQNTRNAVINQLKQTGEFETVVSDAYFASASKSAKSLPSLDLIVLGYGIKQPGIEQALETIQKDYRLAYCPTIIVTSASELAGARKLKNDYPFVEVVSDQTPLDNALQTEKIQEIMSRNQANVFARELADTYAIRAANILRQLAITDNKILPLKLAEQALVDALEDKRPEIQTAAIETLARMDSAQAQRSLADMALNKNLELETRLLVFRNLAVSAKLFDNLLRTEQVNTMYNDIVSSQTVDSELRTLASEAYGALNLPSEKISQLILDQSAE